MVPHKKKRVDLCRGKVNVCCGKVDFSLEKIDLCRGKDCVVADMVTALLILEGSIRLALPQAKNVVLPFDMKERFV